VFSRPFLAPATLLRLVAALLAGAALLVAFPPYDLVLGAPMGVAALVLAVRGRRARAAAGFGLLTGLTFFVPLLSWSGIFVGVLPWLLLAVSQAVFLAGLGAGLAVVTRLPGWPLWAAGLWVAVEALRARAPFGGFPWGRLAFSSSALDGPYADLARLGGAPLVSFALALTGGLAAAALLALRRAPLRAGGTALLAAAVAGCGLLVPPPDLSGRRVVVAAVQGNVPRLGLDFNAQREAVLRNHVSATLDLAGAVRAGRVPAPDLVLWPENASDIDPFHDPAAGARISAAVDAIGVPVLVGAILRGPGEDKRTNAGIVWNPGTGAGERYVKRHPVPFAEYIPLRGLSRLVSDKVDLVQRDVVAGSEPGVLQVGSATVADAICFEVAYDALVRDGVTSGGQLIVVQTNNATFGRSAETVQQLAMSRLRAIEHGRPTIVAATSGISAIVDPTGRVTDSAGILERDVLVQEVPLPTATTPATRLGAVPEVLLGLAGIAALGVALLSAPLAARRRRRQLLAHADRAPR